MEPALALWQRRSGESWIHGVPAETLRARVDECRKKFAAMSAPRCVGVVAPEPLEIVVQFLAAVTSADPVQLFLGAVPAETAPVSSGHSRIMIATGGTSGAPRYAAHTWESLSAAARGLQTALGGGGIHSVCFLPLTHVSGLMQVVRSFVSGGTLVLADGRALGGGHFPAVPAGAVTSIVPTQLARMLEVSGGAQWLRSFHAVFLGGGPAWPALLDRARRERLPLAPCYGMTETAAQVTTMLPDDFLGGREGVGRALPHSQVEIVEEKSGSLRAAGLAGRIRVRGASVFLGYHGEAATGRSDFLTADRGILDVDGRLTVLGRDDAVIITGGEKVDPAEVEAAIRATGLVQDVAVLGVPHAEWGEAVVAVIAGAVPGAEREIAARVRTQLMAPQRPKHWVHVAALPRTEAGKIDRRQLRELAGR